MAENTIFSGVVFENDIFILEIGSDGCAKRLFHKAEKREMLENTHTPMFSVTQDRLFNNELKLAHPNKRSTFSSNSVEFINDRLIVSFELLQYRAEIKVSVKERYIAFELVDFIVPEHAFEGLRMDVPPVSSFRLAQLPIIGLPNFGEWLNVAFDEKTAVNLIGTDKSSIIDAQKGVGCVTLTADCVRGIKLKGCSCALIISKKDELLNAIEDVENDFDLPKGVKSRNDKRINASVYWTSDATPENIDEHIKYAKMGGFTLMLMYYTCAVKESTRYYHCGNYDLRDEYKNGYDDLRAMLKKVKDAGITPGLHFLHTHIGLKSRYCTPKADHRLNIKEKFTLSASLGKDDTVIYVEEDPSFAPMHKDCRVLVFDGEMISYESYSLEPPFRFMGCKRGWNDTDIVPHPAGRCGGVLDISEYGASSVYVDQNSTLQDEIADKIAKIYNCGFEFVYFDGSEGTNAPFEYHVPSAQYRVYKKLFPAPIFCEGAAKSHFSWHMLSGGNAFDIFPTNIFKEMIIKYPAEEAPRMANDFTRVNFGWWAFFEDTTPDVYEYGTSKAFAYNCPATMQARLERFEKNPNTKAVLEVMRRWEYARQNDILTDEQKEAIKDPNREFTLIINENGEYELKEC